MPRNIRLKQILAVLLVALVVIIFIPDVKADKVKRHTLCYYLKTPITLKPAESKIEASIWEETETIIGSDDDSATTALNRAREACQRNGGIPLI